MHQKGSPGGAQSYIMHRGSGGSDAHHGEPGRVDCFCSPSDDLDKFLYNYV